MKLQFTCRACWETRPDEKISVKSIESGPPQLPATIKQNFQYCNDRQPCIDAAHKWKGYSL